MRLKHAMKTVDKVLALFAYIPVGVIVIAFKPIMYAAYVGKISIRKFMKSNWADPETWL